jgi:N-acetylmuramoyl-L-alanine amidase
MKVRRHRLLHDDDEPVRFEATPNLSDGRLAPSYLVIHYTAGRDLQSSVRWLTNPGAGASAHLVIGRDGEIVQLAAFDRVAWHAGQSRWRGLEGLNRHSIGIELDNAGALQRQAGRWRAWFGADYPETDVLEAVHKNEAVSRGWQLFTEEQLEATALVARLVVDQYGLKDVIGHDDIAPGRKQDPGPAFPLASVRSRAMGREDDEFELFETVTALNIRVGPGTAFEKLPRSPLAEGTRLKVLASQLSWCAVEVLGPDGGGDLTGWVHGDYIRPLA